MKPKVYLISDLHFGHRKMYEQPFTRKDGSRLRLWPTAEQADQEMVRRWNAVVRPDDKVYVLGDLAMTASALETVGELNGTKVLVAGNHESLNVKKYVPYFKDIRSYWRLDQFLLSHMPVHPDCLGKNIGNIHGHLHYHVVRLPGGAVDPRYLNVSVEHTDYAPIDFETVKARFMAQQPWVK